MNQEVVDAISQIIREKNIDRDTFQEIIESVFLKAIEKRYGTSENFSVIFNLEKGDIEIYAEKEVVPDGEVEEEALEIKLSKARETDPDIEVGDEFVEVIDYNSFGRRLVLSTKQNLIQKIKEIEKQNLYDEFSGRIGEIVIGDVHQANRREIRINVDKTEVIMPQPEQIYSERWRRGQSIKAIILEVRETSREPQIIVSRRSELFVRRLFELEVPEIYDGIVEIRKIAREAGDRTKIAVTSNDPRVDPVGACVGMKGVRIQAIVRELNNEKIDIIEYTSDRELMVRRSLQPVIPLEILFHETAPQVTVVVPDDQMSMAIGRRGQNIRLASEITGHQIDPIKESEYYIEELPLSEVEELTPETLALLSAAGLNTADEVMDAGVEGLIQLDGMDEEQARSLLEVLETYFEE
ncbi:MAG: Transcription termination/antitermination protein NusA [Calditrichaeota bacterium]|nr:Transcription termination/antitermination protein NusA [Calditrichota bacterium]